MDATIAAASPERKAYFAFFLLGQQHGAPERSPARIGWITAGKQHVQFVTAQEPAARAIAGRPMDEPPSRKPLLAKPIPLAIVQQYLDGGSPAIAKDERPAIHRIAFELLPADRCQAAYPAPKVDRLHRRQNAHRGTGLDHAVSLHSIRPSDRACAAAPPFRWIRSF